MPYHAEFQNTKPVNEVTALKLWLLKTMVTKLWMASNCGNIIPTMAVMDDNLTIMGQALHVKKELQEYLSISSSQNSL